MELAKIVLRAKRPDPYMTAALATAPAHVEPARGGLRSRA
jgi:hypothetical protein